VTEVTVVQACGGSDVGNFQAVFSLEENPIYGFHNHTNCIAGGGVTIKNEIQNLI
jgi:hypothetical protein